MKSTRLCLRFLVGVAMALAVLPGCDSQRPPTQKNKESGLADTDGLPAAQIYQKMRDCYRSATSYRDEAVLYLAYSMDGRNIQEEQAWRVAWNKQEGLNALWFNAEIRGNRTHLGCFIYDLESGNLDNQWLVIPRQNLAGIERILADPLARHFATGFAELPLKSTTGSPSPALTPPTIGWLTGEAVWSQFDVPEKWSRKKDAKVDGQACYHLEFRDSSESLDLWIDQTTWVVRQMTIPQSLLDPVVTGSGEVSDIQFFARMHQAQFNCDLPIEQFQLTPPRNAVPVQQFVTIPEPFPCESIGDPLGELRLFQEDGTQWKPQNLAGRTTVLVWLAGLNGTGAIARINELRETAGQIQEIAGVDWYFVFTDDQMDSASSGTAVVHRSLAQLGKQTGVSPKWLFDQQLTAAQSVRLAATPAVLVIGPTSTIEYARPIVDVGWSQALAAAIRRVGAGEHLAQEMKQDYEQFVERYQQKLKLVALDPTRLSESSPETDQRSGLPLSVQLQWSNTTLKQPGNLTLVSNQSARRLIVFDGWRTLCELNENGEVVKSKELELPLGESASILRPTPSGSPTQFAAFSTSGRSISILDDQFSRVARIETPESDQLWDCHFQDHGTEIRLLVAFRQAGLRTYDRNGKELKTIFSGPIESFQIMGNQIFTLHQGQLGCLKGDEQDTWTSTSIPTELTVVRLFPISPERLGTIGIDSASRWKLGVLDTRNLTWTMTSAPASVFDSAIEPFARTTEHLVLADAHGGLTVYDLARMDDVQRVALPDLASGVAAWESPDGIEVVISRADGVFCYKVAPPSRDTSGRVPR